LLFVGNDPSFTDESGGAELRQLSQLKFLRCLGLTAAAGGANYPTVNVKLEPPLGLYFSFSILLVFSSFFAFFGVFVGDLGS